MQCFVYKSARRADTYIYLRERDAFDLLPAPLAASLGPLNFVIELALSPERKLAREDVETVIANLRGPGFHLQLPPPPVGTTH
jgi:uncharacterized protein